MVRNRGCAGVGVYGGFKGLAMLVGLGGFRGGGC